MNLAFIPYNTCYFHYRQIISPFLKSPTWLPTKSPTFIVGNQLPQNDNILVFNYFSFRHITDMSPTFFSDIYIGITATITATLPPKRNLHRHLHRQNSINLLRSQTSAKLITFPKLSQKGKNKKI